MPIIPHEDINHIRSNANIVDIISSYLTLDAKGKNYFAICPFHDDHTPSMSISPEKQIYTCFVCGASGNVFTFVQNYENVEFPEAVKIVANKIGYNLKYESSGIKKNQQYYEVMALANKYYINNLNSSEGAKAKDYLKYRKLDETIINEFNIGVAFKDNNLSKLLLNKGYEEKLVIDVGLANRNDSLYDIFRNRIIFPISNEKGEVVAFSGRIYNNEKEISKYVNSKETLIFKKGHILFNYDKARLETQKSKSIIVVEGFMDAIRLYASGIKNVVATMGTALTKEHIFLLKKLNARVILMMDNDEAGEKSTLTNGKSLENSNLETFVIRLTSEKDPDDYIIKNGVEALNNLLKSPMTFFDFKMNFLKKNKDLNKADDLAKYINKVIDELNKVDDDILKDVTINKLTKDYGIDRELLLNKLTKKEPVPKIKILPKSEVKLTKYKKLCEALIYMMMSDIKYIRCYERELGYMPDKEYRQIANDILAFYKLNKDFNLADFISFENKSIYYDTVVRIINTHENQKTMFTEFNNYIRQVKSWIKNEQINELRTKLRSETDINRKEELNDLIIKIKKESDE